MAPDSGDRPAVSLSPEHDWSAAARVLRPALRPGGTPGTDGHDLSLPHGGAPGRSIVRHGPVGLEIAYVLGGDRFDVVVSVEHLLSWAVGVDEVHAAAMANLKSWSDQAAWLDEAEGSRKVVWSDLGQGMDAARILLDDVRARLAADLAPCRPILVGLPERDLLVATATETPDADFEAMFRNYVADRFRAADEPIDDRIFELAGGELVERDS
jgi:hypothetical protein